MLSNTVLLTAANDEVECQAICDLLEQEGIPTLKKYRGADAYLSLYMGGHNDSIEIHVPESAVKKALSVISLFNSDKQKVPSDILLSRNRKPRLHVRILLFLFILAPIITVLILKGCHII